MTASEINKGASGVSVNNISLPLTGGTMLGPLYLYRDPLTSTEAVTKNYADNLVVGLLDDRGNYDASSNLFPSSGGSGTAGAIMKGDLWTVSVIGTLGGVAVRLGDVVRSLTDTPGQTSTNWSILESNFGYTPARAGANTDITSVLLNQTGLVVKGASANALTIKPNETLSTGRTLNVLVNDADRTVSLSGDLTVSGAATISGTSSGTNTGDQTSVSGNAGTATALQNARTIGAVSFNGTANIVPQTIQTVDESSDTTCFPLFGNASGSQTSGQQPKTNSGLTYNSSTNNLGATTFTGALSGNATTATSAATLTTARAIYGNNFDGSAALTQVIASTYGGTGNGFAKLSGPASTEKTFTLPNASDTIGCLGQNNTWTGIQTHNSGKLALAGATSGTITVNAAAVAGSNTITLPAGTTDFSATGGTSQVVKQTSSGGAFTVAQLAVSDLSTATYGSGTTIPLSTNWTTWSPGFTGFSANPTVVARYTLIGKTCFLAVETTVQGTSNTTSFTITNLPFTSANQGMGYWGNAAIALDNGAKTSATLQIDANTSVIVVAKGANTGSGTWTASGNKSATFQIHYEIA